MKIFTSPINHSLDQDSLIGVCASDAVGQLKLVLVKVNHTPPEYSDILAKMRLQQFGQSCTESLPIRIVLPGDIVMQYRILAVAVLRTHRFLYLTQLGRAEFCQRLTDFRYAAHVITRNIFTAPIQPAYDPIAFANHPNTITESATHQEIAVSTLTR